MALQKREKIGLVISFTIIIIVATLFPMLVLAAPSEHVLNLRTISGDIQ